MKSIVISADASGGGKTTVSLGIMKALKNRGYDVQPYKIGPDYIDPAFHKNVTGKDSRNLDIFLMGEDGVKASYSRGKGQLGVVEGVMGLYDGKGITSQYSTASVSKLLDLPVILVISPKAQSVTLCAEINGIIEFEKVNIVGVILNNIGESYYKLLKAAIEKHCNIKVFGYLPRDESLKLKSRHLGLIQSTEVEDLENKIECCSELLEKHVDIDGLLEKFKETDKFEDKFHMKSIGLRTAVALDKAFSFYYKENLELLSELGEIIYFSPIKDKGLPENIDFLYLGGGYPEVFIDAISSNKSMLASIKSALENGLCCYAECGGLMYLTQSIDGKPTVGFLNGKSFMSPKLQNFGYAQIEVNGLKLNCHEFHKSYVQLTENDIYKVTKENYDGTLKQWKCGYKKNNTLAAYPHVHFFSNLDFISSIVNKKLKGCE
jgi:cobyrinic acid a,c-diamide synthase